MYCHLYKLIGFIMKLDGKLAEPRDIWISLCIVALCFLLYNANLRSISAGDAFPARYLPFSILHHHTLLLNPISTLTAQGHRISTMSSKDREDAYWIINVKNEHKVSLYPVAVPLFITPLYLPSILYLNAHNWNPLLLDHAARIMEKISASLIAAITSALLYLLLRRRIEPISAFLFTLVFAFGTTTWVISSQALWQHGFAELLIVGTLLLLTSPCNIRRTLLVGCLCAIIACNRPPDAILAAAFGIYALFWAGRLAPFLLVGAALPIGLELIYNLHTVGIIIGAYGLKGDSSFFHFELLPGLAGLLFSPTHGLFFFSPFLIFLPFYLKQAKRDHNQLTVILGLAVILQLLLYAKADWRQGMCWGPRWLTDCLPILFWMLAPALKSMSKKILVLFVLACITAIAIQTIGAFWYIGSREGVIHAKVASQHRMKAAWDMMNAPFIAELQHKPAPAELLYKLNGNFDTLTTNILNNSINNDVNINLEGWALVNGQSPREVIVILDNRPVISTANFFIRPDVMKTLGLASPGGWNITFSRQNLAPGEHVVGILVKMKELSYPIFLGERRFTVPTQKEQNEYEPENLKKKHDVNNKLYLSAQKAITALRIHQQLQGYWLTSFTNQSSFYDPHLELNVFVNSIMVDLLNPIAAETHLSDVMERTRNYLSKQIEADGLVRYHGNLDASMIGKLGCIISPDSDDTALVWRISPTQNQQLQQNALNTLKQFRTPEGFYKTWLSTYNRYVCINPGKNPNPVDAAIQMNIFMFLAEVDPVAAQALCNSLQQSIKYDQLWVYYQKAPFIPLLRQVDLQRLGCPIKLPLSRLQTDVPGQEYWIFAAQMLQRIMNKKEKINSDEVFEFLQRLSKEDFRSLHQFPPLLYHNDLSASVSRYYWSEDLGYALWLRLYYENDRRYSANRRT